LIINDSKIQLNDLNVTLKCLFQAENNPNQIQKEVLMTIWLLIQLKQVLKQFQRFKRSLNFKRKIART